MSTETSAFVREMLNCTPEGRAALAARRPAEFAAGMTEAPARPAAASSPSSLNTVVIEVPSPPTAAEDGAFLDRAAQALGSLAAAEIGRAIADLEGRANRAPYGSSYNWPSTVRGLAERIARLRAMLVTLESGGVGYRPPSAEDVAELAGGTIARLALASRKYTLSDLVTTLDGRLRFARAKAEGASKAVDSVLATFARHPSDGIEALRERFHKAAREDAAWQLEVASLEKTTAGLGPALGRMVARAVEDAGGGEQVARDLIDVRLVAETGPDVDGEELASLGAQLQALGATPTSSDPGRAERGLQARLAELSEAAARRRSAARDRIAAEATALVDGALAGSLKHWRLLCEAVGANPDSFADGLGGALQSAPFEALQAAGCAGLAGILL